MGTFLGLFLYCVTNQVSGYLQTLVFSDTLAQKCHKTQPAGSSFLMNNQSESINQQGTVQR